ncbi:MULTISPECIES: hypothetical protein [Actinokineospora]|uniref:Uncharacterized protein n=1 Tax=Actinokineospora fastidiosa TaxID=1816 RepID=A0A918GK82_9PSEU|nr:MULTISPECIES: hypothetical protein [Actinokineospora]UVS77613.1 hypothetical protein Actkin_01332 [Actinokineospora sp. UTMC 2448]GGS42196.1 hypothetical protein GCM10010171_41240 [Actinokineospora fastidiosa]
MSRNAVLDVMQAVVLSAVVVDDAGLVLMVRSGDRLELPSGPLLVGEDAAAGVARVVAAATGVAIEVRDLIGLTGGPGFGVCFTARPAAGDLNGHAEWVEPEELPVLPVRPQTRERIEHALAG